MNPMIPITLTPVERWLAGLGLDAVEVDRCPAAECALCGPLPLFVAA